MNEKVSVACLIMSEEGSLLLKRNCEPFGFGIVGGYVKDGETLVSALIREVKEEIGIDIQQEKLIPAGYRLIARNDSFCFLFAYYIGKTIPEIKLSYEHSEYKIVKALYEIDIDKYAGYSSYIISDIVYIVCNLESVYHLKMISEELNLCFVYNEDNIKEGEKNETETKIALMENWKYYTFTNTGTRRDF